MNTKQNEQVVKDLTAAFNEGKFGALVGKVLDPKVVYRHDGKAESAQEWIRASENCLVSFPNAHLDIVSQASDGDRVTTEYEFTGSHLGPFAGQAPTGKSFRVEIKTVNQVKDGLIVGIDEVVDSAALMQQLGLG